jgi:folate-binding protein YgfZ
MRIPTYDRHREWNAGFQDFFGCEIPSDYGDHAAEYWALRRSAVRRDVSYFGKIRVTGRDARDFLHRMLTSDIRSLTPGKGTWTLLLNDKGHVRSDMKIYCLPDESLLVVLPHYRRALIAAELERYVISDDVRLEDATDDWAMFQILGPGADAFLRSAGIGGAPEAHYSHSPVTVGGAEARLIRLPLAYALLTSAATAGAVWDGLSPAMPAGMKAFNIFRIEMGLPLMEIDIDESSLPQEVRLEGALSFTKGCYLGQETMARLDARGHVNRRLCGLTASAPVNSGDPIYRDGREIGRTTSTALSPMLGQTVALGYLRSSHSAAGQAVEIGPNSTIGIVTNLPLRES